MIRKYISMLPLIAALLATLSCDPKEEPTVQDTLTVNPTSLEFEADNSSTKKMVYVTTNGDWKATADSWIHLDNLSGTGKGVITVTVDANSEQDRTGSITVTGAQTAKVSVSQKGKNIVTIVANPDAFDGNKRSSTTYQLLVYSFADSDGDGVGDFKGIQNKLDYLNELGVTALWLSPAHPADSYHGYDVTDYYTVNKQYGTEQDFKNLIDAAHAKGIKIYMDYVLNHSGKGHPWFLEALSNPSGKYRDYYFISSNPEADYSSYPMLKNTYYKNHEGEWQIDRASLKISKTDEAVTTGTSDWNLWYWKPGGEGQALRFKAKGDGTYFLVMDIDGESGMLVRRYMNWDGGSKVGAGSGGSVLTEGKALALKADGGDISFTGSGRYKIELYDMSFFMGAFGSWMPDLNYGDVSVAETNLCFQDLAASADKWINLGVDGFRLDAVKHICGGIGSYYNPSNHILLAKWYQHCNATYKAAGHTDDIFMVGEVWSSHDEEKNYYKGLTSCFEFGYWPLLYKALVNQNARDYVTTVTGFIEDHKKIRAEAGVDGAAETSLFMTNHDHSSVTGGGEVRAADDLGKDPAKEKQAAAMMLTTPGKPFVYQGEELGYWGNSKDRGDEYLRAPILWDKAGKDCAKQGVNGKVDGGMLTSTISVEAQNADANSLLNVYKTWSRLRNTYPALAEGTMTNAGLSGGASIAAWYMTSGSQKLLVIHNTASSAKDVTVKDDLSHPVALLGTATLDHDVLTLGKNTSVVFKL